MTSARESEAGERDLVFRKVKAALAPLAHRAALPEYDLSLLAARAPGGGRDRLAAFSERLQRANGLAMTDPAQLAEFLRSRQWRRGYCDPELWARLGPSFGPGFTVETEFDRARADDYAFGVTRAAGAVAETGTIILDDRTTSCRLAALAPWTHVAVLARSQILADLPEAVAAFGADPNVIWCTGSSSTADVEGILVHGAHGPGVQIALVLD